MTTNPVMKSIAIKRAMIIEPPNLVLDEGVEPSRRSNPELSAVYKTAPHSRCYPSLVDGGRLELPMSYKGRLLYRQGPYRFDDPSKPNQILIRS
jgi:hypothetical protein